MAATNVVNIDPAQKAKIGLRLMGTGAIAASDDLVTNVKKYPPGTSYYDKTNHILAFREGSAGVIGDWYKSAAFTVAS